MALQQVRRPLLPFVQQPLQRVQPAGSLVSAQQLGGRGGRAGTGVEQRDVQLAPGEGLVDDGKVADHDRQEERAGDGGQQPHRASALIPPPRTVAPTTIPALISTRFLMMYCPSRVGAHGKRAKTSWGNSAMGVKVPSIWTYRSSRNSR